MKINKSLFKNLCLTLVLAAGVVSFTWYGGEYLNFTAYAGNSLARTAKSLLAQVSSSASSPIVSKVALTGSGVVGDSWQVGTTNALTWNYGNFSPAIKTVSLSLCNPITSGSFEYCILMSHGPGQQQNKVLSGDGQTAGTATSLQPLGQAVVSKHINPYYHLSVEEKKAKGATLAAAFSGYRTRIKVCPTDDLGQTPSGARCAYSQIYYVSDPANPPPSSELSVTTFPPTVSTVNISGSGMVSNTRWQVGTSNTLSWTYKDFSSTAKTVSLSLCNPAPSGTNEYCILMSQGPNQPQNKVSSGGGQGAGTASSIQPFGQAVVSNYINPYYYLSVNEKLAKGAKLAAAFDGYKTRAKICPTDATGQVPAGAVCAYSREYYAYDPNSPLWTTPTVSAVSIEGTNFSKTTGWKVGTSNTFKWSYKGFNSVRTVSLSFCNPTTSGSSEYCFLMSRGPGLEQNKVPSYRIGSATSDPALVGVGTTTSLQPLGPNVVSLHLNPNYYLSLEEKKAKGAFLAAAFDGYTTRVKICPTDANGQVPAGAVCAYSEVYEAYDPANPPPRDPTLPVLVPAVSKVTITGANFSATTGWKVGTSNTFGWTYSDFSNTVKTVALSLCNPATAGTSEYCFLMSRGPGLEQNKVPSGTGNPQGTTTSLQPLGPNVVSLHLNPNYYLSLEEKKAKGAFLAAAFDGYTTRVKICPTDATGQVPAGAVCAYSEAYNAYDPVNPLPRILTNKLIRVVWQDWGDRLELKSGPVVEINRAYPGAEPFYVVESTTAPSEGYYTAKLHNDSGIVISQYGISDPYDVHISFPATCFKINHQFDLEKCGIIPEITAKFSCRPEAKRITVTENSTGQVKASVNLAVTAALCAN